MIYEQVPEIVSSTVRSLFKGVDVEMDTSLAARLFNFFQNNSQIADATVLLSQISLVLCVAFVLFILFVKSQKRLLKAQKDVPAAESSVATNAAVPGGMLRDRWNELLKHLDSTHEAQWKVAVIEADKLVDDALAKAGFSGDTFGDRLSNIQPGTLLSLDGIWWAHKIRNRLAHEVDYFLRYTEARQAVGYFEAALSELQLI